MTRAIGFLTKQDGHKGARLSQYEIPAPGDGTADPQESPIFLRLVEIEQGHRLLVAIRRAQRSSSHCNRPTWLAWVASQTLPPRFLLKKRWSDTLSPALADGNSPTGPDRRGDSAMCPAVWCGLELRFRSRVRRQSAACRSSAGVARHEGRGRWLNLVRAQHCSLGAAPCWDPSSMSSTLTLSWGPSRVYSPKCP
jgi:hypothetical protein